MASVGDAGEAGFCLRLEEEMTALSESSGLRSSCFYADFRSIAVTFKSTPESNQSS